MVRDAEDKKGTFTGLEEFYKHLQCALAPDPTQEQIANGVELAAGNA